MYSVTPNTVYEQAVSLGSSVRFIPSLVSGVVLYIIKFDKLAQIVDKSVGPLKKSVGCSS